MNKPILGIERRPKVPGSEALETGSMDEETFRAFYVTTARLLRAYLARVSGDPTAAEDLLQEAYLRLLRARLPATMEEAHRKNYLYRIATNLLRDHVRRKKYEPLKEVSAAEHPGESLQTQWDVARALDQLKPRERELLWLAYVERFSHKEIAALVGCRTNSIRPLLARARQKLADLLRKSGFGRAHPEG